MKVKVICDLSLREDGHFSLTDIQASAPIFLSLFFFFFLSLGFLKTEWPDMSHTYTPNALGNGSFAAICCYCCGWRGDAFF